jgi:hypothetical protein
MLQFNARLGEIIYLYKLNLKNITKIKIYLIINDCLFSLFFQTSKHLSKF